MGRHQKQKINTGSSTEAKLVAVVDALPNIMWCRHFMEQQGYIVEDVYVYQDNESAILLETNGMRSVGKGSRHIKIKYFFITDKVKGNELKVLHCPTEEMTGDFFTKPLQGALFIKHRNKLLGISEGEMAQHRKYHTNYMESLSRSLQVRQETG